MVYNRADLGVTSFACAHNFLGVLECSQAIYYGHTYWATRAPRELPPATNILGIFTPTSWILILVSILFIIIFLRLSSKVGHYYGLKVELCEIPLIPFQ